MLPTLESPELVFGLCSPIGTDNTQVIKIITDCFSKYNYNCVPFKVTSLMKYFVIPDQPLEEKPTELRYDTHIKYANKLREIFSDDTLLAMMCCGAVRQHRRLKNGDPTKYIERTCYVFDQFKRKEKIDALRQVYGRLFVLICIYSEPEVRLKSLTEKISESHNVSRPTDAHMATAKDLIARDDHEAGVKSGQRLRDAFPSGDVFINIDEPKHAERTISRFLEALFGAYTVSPSKDEYGMYLARNAALRSLDLSRQVGAAIMSSEGEIITLGCNEVPKSGGGTYWCTDTSDSDGRDYKQGHDENDRIKRALLADFVRKMCQGELIKIDQTIEQFVEIIINEVDKKDGKLRDAELMDIIEFGRIIHAEMCALCDAARTGKSVKGATLYCTTFPCHLCAKHIVAAGIMRVLFIEPYPKSYAEQLHSDSITVRTGKSADDKVRFEPFIGISPFRYRDIFERGRRKDNKGKVLKWSESDASPNVRLTVATYIQNEAATVEILHRAASKLATSGKISFKKLPSSDVSIIEMPVDSQEPEQ